MSRRVYGSILALAALCTVVTFVAVSLRASDEKDGTAPGNNKTAKPASDASTKQAGDAVHDGQAAPTPVEAALDKPVALKYTNTPLQEIAASIAKESGINVLVDTKRLADASLAPDAKVTFTCDRLPLHVALRYILEPDLGYVIAGDNTLLITSRDYSRENLIERVYDLYGFVAPPRDAAQTISRTFDPNLLPQHAHSSGLPNSVGDVDYADTIIDTITACIASTTWTESGGSATIAPFDYSLVIEQSDANQRQIAKLLAALRQAKGFNDNGPRDAIEVNTGDSAAAAKLAKTLAERHDYNLVDLPLTELADALGKLNIPVVVDRQALAGAKVDLSAKFTWKERNARIGDGLRRALNAVDLNYWADDGFVFITTPEKCKEHVMPKVYPIGDLLETTTDAFGQQSLDDSDVVALITSSVMPSSWTDVGGSAAIQFVGDARALVICHTAEGHTACAKLLANLRANWHVTPQPALDPNEWLVRRYQINVKPGSLDQCITILRSVIEPKSWTADGVSIIKLDGALVIRQTRAVQDQIGPFLESLGVFQLPRPQQRPFVTS